MSRHFPPLNSLLVFLASARTLSFTQAAEELFVTKSAVSRQIKLLEEYLGVSLFDRTSSGLELTGKGLSYFNDLSLVFADLKIATNQVMGLKEEGKLKLGISATFNSTWLMSRLAEFYQDHPDIAIAFRTNSRDTGKEPVDFDSGEMDAAIRFGTGDWEGCEVTKLLDIYVQPVCAPELLANKDMLSLAKMAEHNWLSYSHLPSLWDEWIQVSGEKPVSTMCKRIELDNVAVAVQAAVDGLGIIPMYRPLADPLLESGRLVVAHPCMMRKKESYYFVCPKAFSGHEPTLLFREWLLNEAHRFSESWSAKYSSQFSD